MTFAKNAESIASSWRTLRILGALCDKKKSNNCKGFGKCALYIRIKGNSIIRV
jgi:hypothetical protein